MDDEATVANAILTVLSPAVVGGFLFWLIKKSLTDTTTALSQKVDSTSASTDEKITRVHQRIDKYEENQRQCQLGLHKSFAAKEEVARLDQKTDSNTERIVSLETKAEFIHGSKQ